MSKREIPQVITDLQAIRARLTPVEMWNKGSYGKEAGPNCIMGVVYMVTDNFRTMSDGIINRKLPIPPATGLFPIQKALRAAIQNMPSKDTCSRSDSIVGFNDTTDHETLLRMIDIAIEIEKHKAGVVEYV